jgi:hypothetical protein
MNEALRRARTRIARRLGGIGAAIGAGPPGCRMLLISDGREYTSEQQFAPIWRYRRMLRHDLGLAVRWLPLDAALHRAAGFFARFDLIGLKLSFRRPAAEAAEIVGRFRSLIDGSWPKLIIFDGDDDSGIQWPALLDETELYVKKHVFRDPAAYAERFIGKSNLTTYVARTTGRSFAEDIIPSAGGADPAALGKLHLGWNIALDDKIAAFAPHPPEADRPIDICGRAWVAPDNWLHGLRAPAISALERLEGQWTVEIPRGRVPQEDYDREMRSAKLCVSPFGYGEICWRDFEAVMHGCLLVKPDTGHVRSLPDLFVAGETYLPVAWDYSDLEMVCAPMLGDSEARIAMAKRAQEKLLDALTPEWFSGRMAELIARFSPRSVDP